MLHLGCKSIHDGITTAIVFLLMGLCLIITGIWVIPQIWFLPHILIISGLFVLLLAPIILIASYFKNK